MRSGSRRRSKRVPGVERLEGLELQSGLLSEAGLAAVAPRAVESRSVHALATRGVPLFGVTSGVATYTRGAADQGLTYSFGTFGNFSGLGRGVASGSIVTTGFVRAGQATGTVTVYTHAGSLTLRLTGPLQSGFAPLPPTFLYTVTGGTGMFAGATGTGGVDVSFRAYPVPPNARVTSGNGRIVLRFHAATA